MPSKQLTGNRQCVEGSNARTGEPGAGKTGRKVSPCFSPRKVRNGQMANATGKQQQALRYEATKRRCVEALAPAKSV